MITEEIAKEIFVGLRMLPPEQVATIRDFVKFLIDRHGKALDYSDEWTDEDLRELTAYSMDTWDQREAEGQS